MRLIDLDTLFDGQTPVKEYISGSLSPSEAYGLVNRIIGVFTKALNEAPVVDAEPVVHGHWGEYETHPLAHSLDGFPCSVCGMHQDDIRGLYYCPNCGARMDGEER